MLKHLPITSERVRIFCEELHRRLYGENRVIPVSVHPARGRIPFSEAVRGEYRPTQEGEKFGPRWATFWFKLEVAIPPEWRGQEVHLRFQSVSEAMLWSAEGRPLEGLVSCDWDQLLDIRSHHRLTPKAKPTEAPRTLTSRPRSPACRASGS